MTDTIKSLLDRIAKLEAELAVEKKKVQSWQTWYRDWNDGLDPNQC